MVLEDRRKKEKSTLSVLLNDETINNGSAASTYIQVINSISNIVGKDILANDFPQIFNREEFINSKYNTKYNSGKDDSDNYFIMTHTDTNYKKSTLDNISKKYNLNLKVDVIGPENTISKKVWLFSPGENAILFDQFYSEGIIALGWDELGDLSQYNSSSDIVELLKTDENNNPTNTAGINFSFAKNISIGDIVIAKRGRTEFIGYGEVTSDYYFDDQREKYKSCRDVKWIEKGSWVNDTMVPIKTLTDATPQASKFLNLIGYNRVELPMVDVSKIEDLCKATLDIKRFMVDDEYLCNRLNSNEVDYREYLRTYYNSTNSGVVIDIRKKVAAEVLLSTIDSTKLNNIVSTSREVNQQQLRSWTNSYNILYPFVNFSYKHLDRFITDSFVKTINSRLGDVKFKISNFNGSRNQGSNEYWIAFYNKNHNHQSDGLQLFISFDEGQMKYGIYRHIDRVHIKQYIFDGDINSFFYFIDDNREMILNDNKKSKEFIEDDIKDIFQKNSNIALTQKEITDRLSIRVDRSLITDILSSNIFEKNEDQKFKLKSYMPTKLKELFENNGFITIDVLKQILEQCGVQVNI